MWNKLPDDLEILVLLWLSPLDLRRLSLTCKYFHSLLSDKSFPTHYDRHRLAHTVFVASLPLQNRMQKTVLKLLIWQQGRNPMSRWQIELFGYLRGSRWWLSSCGDGFVCFRGPCNEKKLLVFNPLFPHEYRILSLPAAFNYQHVLYSAIAFDRKNSVCKLICWAKFSDDIIITGFHNSKEGTWKRIPECGNGSGKHFIIRQSAQLVNERFLCWLCTDTISSVNTVLVFDVEEEMWKEPIPLGNGSFICVIQHEKRLCLIKRRCQKKETIFELWKFDLKQRVLEQLEYIRPPTTRETNYCRGMHLFYGWSRGFLRVVECNIKEKSLCTWVYDISHHSWQSLGDLGIGYDCFEGSLFRLAV